MELNPHDLLMIREAEDLLLPGQSLPDWARISLRRSPFVVVRRVEQQGMYIPVGIRGTRRGERIAAWLPTHRILEVITPYSLANPANWRLAYHPNAAPPAIRTLLAVRPILLRSGYRWGPIGSAAFELASGNITLSDNSDLDLLIDAPSAMTTSEAGSLLEAFEGVATTRMDIQLNTPVGGVSLKEYVSSEKVLIKTPAGPFLQPIQALWY